MTSSQRPGPRPESGYGAGVPAPVCVIARHALVLDDLRRVLEAARFPVYVRRPESTQPLPPAAGFVLDVDGAARDASLPPALLLRRHPTMRLLAVSESFSEALSFELLRMGVKGVMSYADVPQQLATAVTVVTAGGIWVPREIVSRFLDSVVPQLRRPSVDAETGKLSRREREVITSLVENLSNKEIASRLNISERTVKFHISNLLTKFKVRRRSDLIMLAHQQRAV